MDDNRRRFFIEHLEAEVRRYKTTLQGMFGKSDPRFIFGAIRQSTDDTPCIYFPSNYHTHGGCVVDIHISDWPWEHCSYDQGTWQIAHECVHLLDPGIGDTNVLEEGLATWFQDEPQFHDDRVKRYIAKNRAHSASYPSAKELVLLCMPQLVPAVKEIRSTGVRIRDINASTLAAHLPCADKETVNGLCARFT